MFFINIVIFSLDQEIVEEAEYPEGSLVWAQQNGYCFWPGLVTKSQSSQKNPGQTHIHFFGYENDVRIIVTKSLTHSSPRP